MLCKVMETPFNRSWDRACPISSKLAKSQDLGELSQQCGERLRWVAKFKRLVGGTAGGRNWDSAAALIFVELRM